MLVHARILAPNSELTTLLLADTFLEGIVFSKVPCRQSVLSMFLVAGGGSQYKNGFYYEAVQEIEVGAIEQIYLLDHDCTIDMPRRDSRYHQENRQSHEVSKDGGRNDRHRQGHPKISR